MCFSNMFLLFFCLLILGIDTKHTLIPSSQISRSHSWFFLSLAIAATHPDPEVHPSSLFCQPSHESLHSAPTANIALNQVTYDDFFTSAISLCTPLELFFMYQLQWYLFSNIKQSYYCSLIRSCLSCAFWNTRDNI